jgi:hypothetical protein
MSPASISPWQFAQTRMHLLVSARNLAIDFPRPHVHRERFGRWIDVMEVKIDDAPVVAAHRAATAGLLHEQTLELLLAPGNSLTNTPLATPPLTAGPVELVVELDPAMVLTEADLRGALRGRRSPTPSN